MQMKTVTEIKEYLSHSDENHYSINMFCLYVKNLELEDVRQIKFHCVKHQEYQEAAICRDIEMNHKDFVLYAGLLIEFKPYDLERYGIRDEDVKLKHIKIYAKPYEVKKIL